LFTDHVTFWFELPVTCAVKDCTSPARSVAVGGVTCTLMPVLATTWAVRLPEEIAPGSGFFTVIEMLPTCPLVAVPVAVSCVDETRVVVNVALPKLIAAPVAKCAPLTVKLNDPTGMDNGATVVICGTGLFNVMALLAVLVESAAATAPIVIALADGGNSGAVYMPAAVIIPTEALPPATPFTDQLTAAGAPSIFAVKV